MLTNSSVLKVKKNLYIYSTINQLTNNYQNCYSYYSFNRKTPKQWIYQEILIAKFKFTAAMSAAIGKSNDRECTGWLRFHEDSPELDD